MIMINTVGHTIELISTLKRWGKCCGCTLSTDPQYLTSEFHGVGNGVSMGLQIVCI